MPFANSREIFRGGQNNLFQKYRKNTSILLFWHNLLLKKQETKIYQGNYKASIGKYYLFL
jgi:hypothetical protein